MEVEVSTNIEICKNVHVTVEDITAALADYEQDLKYIGTVHGEGDDQTVNATKMLITAAWQCLTAVQDETIAEMLPKQKQLVADALYKEACRYRD